MNIFHIATTGCLLTLMIANAPGAEAQVQAPTAQKTEKADEQDENLAEIPGAISELMQQYHYDPSILSNPEYLAIEQKVASLANSASTQAEFVAAFNKAWRDGPFSHVRLSVARMTASEMATYVDTIRIGGGGAVLDWQDDIAILTVKTMMGLDTIEEIDAAFLDIAKRPTRGLIIDLRANDGGAFAVKPLVGHVVDTPVLGGVFVSRKWSGKHDRYPSQSEVEAVAPWQGWSVKAFWYDLQSDPMIRMEINPAQPTFDGPVYVLVSSRTASAAELAADAFAASGRAVIIGEQTAGQMLSQTMFDLPGGLQLALPVGDYYAFHSGRIEGKGVQPHIKVEADDAMTTALKLIGN
ncbi:S41 family peptidase [Parasphingorhabdus sp.]|uniref:S41 family peptidase n=1 Tax=Parasphingorhabdus sp. TaxID=2709688 RepID=UPI003D2AC134